MSNDTFGIRLKNLIKIKDFTVKEFSNIAGLSQPNFYKYFKGESLPTVALLQKIIEEWPDVNIYWLLTGEGEPLANEGSKAFLGPSNDEQKKLKEKLAQLEEKLAERDKTVEFQEKSLDTIIAMLKDRGIDIYEEE